MEKYLCVLSKIEVIFWNTTLHSLSKLLVNGLVLRERINAKPLVTIFFFKILDKTGNFAVLRFTVQVPANQYISR